MLVNNKTSFSEGRICAKSIFMIKSDHKENCSEESEDDSHDDNEENAAKKIKL